MQVARTSDRRNASTLCEVIAGLTAADRGLTFVGPDERRTTSYAALREIAAQTGRALNAAGVAPGERTILVLADQQEFVRVFLGAASGGAIPVPAYPPLSLGDPDAYAASVARLARIAGAGSIVCERWLHEWLGGIANVKLIAPEALHADAPPAPHRSSAPDDVAFLQFTSGSTAAPRGVRITHRSLLANVYAIADHLDDGHEEDEGVVSWLPMYHDMGLIGVLITALARQVPVWLIPPLEFVRRPSSWCELIHETRATISFAPSFAYALAARRISEHEAASWDLSCWRVAGCGAEPIRADALDGFARQLAPAGFSLNAFMPCYGLAEATLAVTLAPLYRPLVTLDHGSADGRPPRQHVVCGRPIAGHELRIVDADGQELPAGQEGAVLVRGPSVADGYDGDPDATAATFRGAWLHTCDRGFLHHGELVVTGREKDLIIVNGRNHHPQDIEWLVSDLANVRTGNVVAFGCADPGGSERPVVALERRAAADAAALRGEVVALVRARLGLSLRDVVVLEPGELPKTSSGKVRRSAMRLRYEDAALAGAR
jgi:fatty-acyl-CoA synthase